MPDNACIESDQIEDIEDMMRGEGGGQAEPLPRDRFTSSRREVLMRPKKRNKGAGAVTGGREGVEDVKVLDQTTK